MERDFMGLNVKEEAAMEAEGFQSFNNHHSPEIKKWIGGSTGTHSVQLTIFYGGMVNVYDDISPEKAQAIMLLAGNGSRVQAHMATPRTPAGDGANKTLSSQGSMRGASLARFLEKRKERVMASAPYNLGKSSFGKPESSNGPEKDDKQ
ncbi:CO/COL/TOC1, conserved site-containing protein [Cynara cardunculus var. scolymus]|uniref:Protein TIFY n=1 Tax=Cynara cardunculus var. scolymus TaxID=59895 RepID=A0A124SDQ6_CYNCS|nr:CO/COL/TOC1, conserved site-containing protein [Cynara cardunculus var. scolymus]